MSQYAQPTPSTIPPPWLSRIGASVANLAPGIGLAAAVTLAAVWANDGLGVPTMLGALFLGMALPVRLRKNPRMCDGVAFVAKPVLRLGVALLGARITVGQILDLGLAPVVIVILAVTSTILFGLLMARIMGFQQKFGVLTAGATAICGASAALTISSVLPRDDEHDRNTIFTVIGVTTLSTVVMIAYPPLVHLLEFTVKEGGILLGGTIHDVAQVVGAGYSVSPEVGDVATFTKLLRVVLLLPVTLLISWAYRDRGNSEGKAAITLPRFLIGFIVLMLLSSSGILAEPIRSALSQSSKWCLIAAVAALGMQTSLGALKSVGGRAIALIVLETVFLLTIVLSALLLWP